MLIRPTEEELADFGEPDFIIYNAGQFPANRFTKGMSSTTSVEINFKRMEMVFKRGLVEMGLPVARTMEVYGGKIFFVVI